MYRKSTDLEYYRDGKVVLDADGVEIQPITAVETEPFYSLFRNLSKVSVPPSVVAYSNHADGTQALWIPMSERDGALAPSSQSLPYNVELPEGTWRVRVATTGPKTEFIIYPPGGAASYRQYDPEFTLESVGGSTIIRLLPGSSEAKSSLVIERG